MYEARFCRTRRHGRRPGDVFNQSSPLTQPPSRRDSRSLSCRRRRSRAARNNYGGGGGDATKAGDGHGRRSLKTSVTQGYLHDALISAAQLRRRYHRQQQLKPGQDPSFQIPGWAVARRDCHATTDYHRCVQFAMPLCYTCNNPTFRC